MSILNVIAFLLIIAGVVALAYGGIAYTKNSHDTKLGPLEVSIKDQNTIMLPFAVGICAIVIGFVLLLLIM